MKLKEKLKEVIETEANKYNEFVKYDNMNENDQFDVYQEICVNICWSGFHKCMEYDEDNELIGVNVDKIRDDYNNRSEEMFYCEKCKYCSKKMDDVKKHFMLNHKKTYKCWECEKEIETISVFKRHYGTHHFISEDLTED